MPHGVGVGGKPTSPLDWRSGSLRDGQQAGGSYGRWPQAQDTFLAPSRITGVEPNGESRGASRRTLLPRCDEPWSVPGRGRGAGDW